MLTPANTFLLGLIANEPINPYDIINRFAYNRYNAILQIADSTIYSNIRTMCKKRLYRIYPPAGQRHACQKDVYHYRNRSE